MSSTTNTRNRIATTAAAGIIAFLGVGVTQATAQRFSGNERPVEIEEVQQLKVEAKAASGDQRPVVPPSERPEVETEVPSKPYTAADWNRDEAEDILDLLSFLDAWYDGKGDFDEDDDSDNWDLIMFLEAFFTSQTVAP